LHLLHPQGRNEVEDGAGRSFLSREEWAQPRGRNFGPTVAARGQEAKPSPANQSHWRGRGWARIPVVTPKVIRQVSVGAFDVWRAGTTRKTVRPGLPNQEATPAGTAMDQCTVAPDFCGGCYRWGRWQTAGQAVPVPSAHDPALAPIRLPVRRWSAVAAASDLVPPVPTAT